MKIYRQGDVLLISTNGQIVPEKILPPDNGRIILAYGEVTGHSHAIDDTDRVVKFEASGKTFLQVIEEVGLSHEEHSEIKLPKGIYQVLIQSEYAPGELRNVQD